MKITKNIRKFSNKTKKNYKKTNNIMNLIISSGLNIPYNSHYNNYKNIIPKNVFGVFVSVKRSYNNEIHGCIGNFNKDFTNMNNNDIIDKLKQVSYSATNEDPRKEKFDKLYLDYRSKYEISFMLNKPLYINKITGKINNSIYFDNNNYGVIFIYNNNSAVYLPKVFKNRSWEYIRNSLLEKNFNKKLSLNEIKVILSDNKCNFYAYKVKIIEETIFSIINNDYITYIYNNFIMHINKNIDNFVLYALENNKKIIDKTQYVRNSGMLYTISFFYNNLNNNLKNILLQNLIYYLNIFINNNKIMRQSLPFLLLCIKNLEKHFSKKYKKIFTKFKKKITEYLENEIIKNDKIDENFELGEICMALNMVKSNKNLLKNIDNNMFNSIKHEKLTINSIFRINWHIKFLYNNPYNIVYNKYHKEYLKKNMEIICEKLNYNYETNYLAVGFEALTTCKSNRKDLLFKLFYLLQKRYKNGLYYFKDMSYARYDITGHIIEGFMNF